MACHSSWGFVDELITPIGPSIELSKKSGIKILQLVKIKEFYKFSACEVSAPTVQIDLMMKFLQKGQRMCLTMRRQLRERCNQFSNERRSGSWVANDEDWGFHG
jgi:hypothetical protein